MNDTLIIGAGPGGLAMARALRARNLPYTHVERHSGVGGLWDIDNPGSPMYESAHFISSKTLSNFVGFPMPEHYPDYPTRTQILDYLRSFADHYGLTEHIEFNTAIESVTKTDHGTYLARRADGTLTEHAHVVAATGVQWEPNVPAIPGDFAGEVRHTVGYRSAEEFRGKRVLVVGAGNSGCDIACDAARTADAAFISVRRGYWFIPKHVFGIPVDVFAEGGPHLPTWLSQRVFGTMLRVIVGDLTRLGLPKPDHKLFESHPILNAQLIHHLQHGDVIAKPAIAGSHGHTVEFADGTAADVDLIMLATGYRHTVPYAQPLFGSEQHPDALYLTSFSPHSGLYGIGYVETNSAAYQLMSSLAACIASHIADRDSRPEAWARFERMISEDKPDLSGGIRFIDSPRHQGYVDSTAIAHYLKKVGKKMGWDLALDAVPAKATR